MHRNVRDFVRFSCAPIVSLIQPFPLLVGGTTLAKSGAHAHACLRGKRFALKIAPDENPARRSWGEIAPHTTPPEHTRARAIFVQAEVFVLEQLDRNDDEHAFLEDFGTPDAIRDATRRMSSAAPEVDVTRARRKTLPNQARRMRGPRTCRSTRVRA